MIELVEDIIEHRATLGGWVLVRTAGLPVRLWLAAANPRLTGELREFVAAEDRYADLGRLTAAGIGAVLVPHPAVDDATRRTALACRRRLHRGTPADPADLSLLAAAARDLGRPELAERIGAVSRYAESLAARRGELAADVEAESARLLAASWEAVTGSPVGRRALRDGTIAAGEDTEARLRRGEPWHGKRLRRRSDYLWRMIVRGAAKTTPRGWLGQVALLPVGYAAPRVATLVADAAARWTENVHTARLSATGGPVLSDGARVSFAPLHRVVDGHLDVWSVRPGEPAATVQPIRLRMTPHLEVVRTALRAGARPLSEVVAATSPDPADHRHATRLRGFVSRLVEMGVCEASRPPRVRRTGWRDVGVLDGEPRPDPPGFVDVYRRAAESWPAETVELVESALGTVQRLNRLMTADETDDGLDTIAPAFDAGAEPRPVLDLLADRLGDGEPADDLRQARWPVPRRPGSGYARLLEMLGRARRSVDITEDLLDRLGAPPSAYEWPVDCLIRPSREGAVVLDSVASAGMLDARFTAELTALHGPLPHVAAYRDFLRLLDAETGVRSVEFLAPCLSERAANAVSRPLYTELWTGDPDLTAYCPDVSRIARYIPLDTMAVRRRGGRLVVEAGGSPVRILYHATRRLPPPWSLLLSILQGGPTLVAMRFRRLRHSLAALPGLDRVPRITVAGSVIVTPAQWRIRHDDLWDPVDSPLVKACRLARLRDSLGLPRWIMVCPGLGDRPVPCDLDSLRAPAVIEAAAAAARATPDGDALIVEEMVPTPEELPVRDLAAGRADPVAAELMLRLPHDVDVATLARRTARAMTSRSRDETKLGELSWK